VLSIVAWPGADLRAARANRVFCTDKKRIRTKNTVMVNTKHSAGGIQDRQLRADVLFIRAQLTIRADGFSSAQHSTLQLQERDLSRHV
jgi:hypothetical protein